MSSDTIPKFPELKPQPENAENMWELAKLLFPVYRTLCGPGFKKVLQIINEYMPLNIQSYPTGSKVFDWVIPKEFKVNEAWVSNSRGERIFDFEKCPLHVWAYSQPFDGTLSREELISRISVSEALPNAIPSSVTYYRSKWGLSASQEQVKKLVDSSYRVHIDTEHSDGELQIGEYYISGQTKKEIIFSCYLCHPAQANDGLSGALVLIELFKLMKNINPYYSYRLLIWPESIGAITYIYHHKDEIMKNVQGGCIATCLGDSGCFHYKKSFNGNGLLDKAAQHVLTHGRIPFKTIPYVSTGSDECHFNSVGLRKPFVSLMRTPYAKFPAYHTSLDNLGFISKENLLGSLELYSSLVMTLERNHKYKANFCINPFLTALGIYPFSHNAGEGKVPDDIGMAYYHLMGWADGEHDLIDAAENVKFPIHYFDQAVYDFLRKDLIRRVD
jgi:aminopeptidase-like protein